MQVLDRYFGNVCELDLIFNFHKAYYILDELLIAGEQQETSKKTVNMLHIRYPRTTNVQHRCCSGCAITCVCRAY